MYHLCHLRILGQVSVAWENFAILLIWESLDSSFSRATIPASYLVILFTPKLHEKHAIKMNQEAKRKMKKLNCPYAQGRNHVRLVT